MLRLDLDAGVLTLLQDVHTSRWIVDKCFRGDLVRNRTVILVVRLLSRIRNCCLTQRVDPQRGFGRTDRRLRGSSR